MDIWINKQNLDHINRQMESGRYDSPNEVISKALDLLDEHHQELAEVRAKVQTGIGQADTGQLIPAEEVFDELKQRNSAAKQAE